MFRSLLVAVLACISLAMPSLAQTGDTETGSADYVGSASCANCHEGEAKAWQGSHHALAWTLPTPETVLADFDDSEFNHDGVRYAFSRAGAQFRVTITEVDGSEKTHDIHSVAGIAPLQQYLIETEPGRLQSFDVVWDVDGARWYHLYPEQDLPPGDGLHWTGPYKNWNARCAECHATGFEKNYDAASDSYHSQQAEIGVGCEACHGPGSAHVTWAETARERSPQDPLLPPEGYGLAMDFNTAGTEAMIQQCAGCHSRREPMGQGNPIPGTPYHDAYTLSLLRPGLYHADGQLLDEVYVYGSFLQSKMYQRGVGCLDCHEPHGATLRAEDNSLCTQCHSPAANPRFPSLKAALYDDPAHTFHPKGSAGAECKSCHMIERDYMGIDGRRDHSFRIPRPDLAAVTGGSDACTDCHADQDAGWAAAEIAQRYPDAAKRPHYGTVLAAGRADPVAAGPGLRILAQDRDQAGLVRATALWLLSQGGDANSAEFLAGLLEDDDPLVRAAAIGVQRAAPPQTRVQRLIPLLADPVRMVRIETAKAMLDAPIARLPARIEAQMQAAMTDWRRALAARVDFPETHMVMAGMALTMRNIPAARGAFRQVVAMDPQREEAWIMLARIAAAMDGPEATAGVLDEALEKLPHSAALNEMKRSVAEQ
ncbi:HEAT repeat domain-containing protein [Ruegeria pomeroyi]|nr:HEAT repeat domain-containing protein [Ruegeria pomeroyi]